MSDLSPQQSQIKNAAALAIAFSFEAAVPSPSSDYSIAISNPDKLWAIGSLCDVEGLLTHQLPQDPNRFVAVVIFAGASANAATLESRANAWVRGAVAASDTPPFKAVSRAGSLVWTEGRALLTCQGESLSDVLNAVLRFTVAERTCRAIEAKVQDFWPAIAEDASLIHSINKQDHAAQSRVDARTLDAVALKSRFLRLWIAIEQTDNRLSDASRRLFDELASQAKLESRVEILDDPVQYALDHYEIVNFRLSEDRNARKEWHHALTGYILETLIILVLLFQAWFQHH